MNVLIDTNVILDAMVSRAPFNESAEKLFLLAAEDKITAFITANSVTDIYYLLHKHLHDNTQCRQALLKIFTIFKILDVTGSDCEKALELLTMPDYEDALLATCAKRGKVDCIITRNLKDFSVSPVNALSPDDFLKKYL
ncbi:PIN domain-containing protein [Pelotomaculum terephthalicicum JT]|uniref:PIN domain-containing protein n=1 Tax=Pelotomaculum TaxID=191373 RepID=UPI0009CD67CD|nr:MULTISPECIES: PIN domain-containing protein [Pelotomaculum]MCG9969200.1 PIN domain-containing protein [Pelotomaculum terephthalicicum JT]OPX89935.1 MAG: PIN domain protein [Pelotomaculum sp. PtaB.Bin117]OPY62171.1 MAG: PIN domain protein [Pelotomaculum sp. PtaU1.Bin065]